MISPARFYGQRPTGDFIKHNWAPTIDLDDPCINPDVAYCLLDYVSDFIFYWSSRNIHGLTDVAERATSMLMHAFDFNRDMEYPTEPYRIEMMVRSHLRTQDSIFPTHYCCSVQSVLGCGVAAPLALHAKLPAAPWI
jgi:hypothetical protein